MKIEGIVTAMISECHFKKYNFTKYIINTVYRFTMYRQWGI